MRCPECGSFIDYKNRNRCSRWPICRFVDNSAKNIKLERYIVFDLETSGFNRKEDRIIEIGAVLVEQGMIIKRFDKLCNPGKFISATISEVTNITNDMLKNAETEKRVVKEFVKFVSETNTEICIGHNIKRFDTPFFTNACKRAGVKNPFKYQLDTMNLAISLKLKERGLVANNKQPTLAEYYNIKYEAHRAINDVEALSQIFAYMAKEAGDNLQLQVENI